MSDLDDEDDLYEVEKHGMEMPPPRPEDQNSERVRVALKRHGLAIAKLKVDTENQSRALHKAFFHTTKEVKGLRDVAEQMSDVHKMVNIAVFGDETLKVNGLVKDNDTTQKLVTKVTIIWGVACFVCASVSPVITKYIFNQ